MANISKIAIGSTTYDINDSKAVKFDGSTAVGSDELPVYVKDNGSAEPIKTISAERIILTDSQDSTKKYLLRVVNGSLNLVEYVEES